MGDHDFAVPQSLGRPSDEALRNDSGPTTDQNDGDAADAQPDSPSPETPLSDSGAKPQGPMQKRRRVTRACDECRRKKIKCDGKQPCTHCTVYSYDCTYDQPSNRRRNPAPQYIEALEQRLQKAESVLRTVLPGLDLDDPKFDARTVEQLIETSRAKTAVNTDTKPNAEASKPEDDAQLQSMVDRTGTLDLDDHGNWDFHGQSSGYVFMRKFRAQFGDQFLSEYTHPPKNRTIAQVLESPRSANSSPIDLNLPHHVDLPPKEVAIELCRNTLDDACALMRPLHRPTFFKRLNAIYDTEPEQYNNHHVQFLPQLYVIMAVGCLFSKTEYENSVLDLKGYKEAIEQGYQYFSTAKQLLDITDCRDLVTIQAIAFMILFLQSSAKLPICYAYVGIALRACCRLGLHRNLPTKFSPIESEERKRIFWMVRKLDAYVGAALGLPQMLSDEDIDQVYPSEVDDECITEQAILPMPAGTFPLLRATNAHTRLTMVMRKVVRYIYPLKPLDNSKAESVYSISHKKIRELEKDLQNWMDQLPTELRPADNVGRDLERVQQHLRMGYAHVQMMLYRPFVHYVSQACQARNVDKRSFACAAACISVARNVVHIMSEMKKRGLLVGSYWFFMYTTYFAILSLVFFVIENPNNSASNEILKDALEGRDTLASLAKRSMAADRCTVSLTGLFDVLPEKLKERRSSLNLPPASTRKRPPPGPEAGPQQERQTIPDLATPSSSREHSATPSRARTLPSDYLAKLAKRNSMPDPVLANFHDQLQNAQLMGLHSPSTSSPMSPNYQFTPQLGNAEIPDLKNLMFPSDNPFAYPNQPMSALESADGRYSFSEASMTPSESNLFGTPSSGTHQIPQQFGAYDFGFQPALNGNPTLAQQFAAQANRDFNAPFTDILMQNTMGHDMTHLGGIPRTSEPASMGDMNMTANPGEYWKGLGSGQSGIEQGLSQTNVDYFGSEGWNPAWGDEQQYSNHFHVEG
ncbi:Gypsy retrotransposon integrase-like protein 1 [Cladophialophora chaetospira]|uniref:Gypsy retrotransposon integrase-like protein 1 n=1 Tax=Cladophialophora chaetospira TaxID=386627 RepID=A0AA38X8A4_9EURO|nr:Gypsy retrotransposon integrase-like protein 1 [Cladophialophora chaetospira]